MDKLYQIKNKEEHIMGKKKLVSFSIIVLILLGVILFFMVTTRKNNDGKEQEKENISTEDVEHSIHDSIGMEGFECVATYEANLCHTVDAANEVTLENIEIYVGNAGDGECGFVLIETIAEDGTLTNQPYSIEAHTARAGWNNIFLVGAGEKDYILTMQIELRDTYGKIGYQVYAFEEQLGENLAEVQLDGVIQTMSETALESYRGNALLEQIKAEW